MSTTSPAAEVHDIINRYSTYIDDALKSAAVSWPETPLFAPVRYLLNLGGKRLRPMLVIAACEAESGSPEAALPAALAVEIFHNFTLMHDDIMDDAPLRRGRATVHEKWNTNTAILSGDAMFVQAYQALVEVNASLLPHMLRLFNHTAIEVCEGQEQDMAFEERSDVSVEEYLEMIRLKTSVLLAASLQLGAMAAGSPAERADRYYTLGLYIGLAFQLQDDYLDAFGDPEHFGKVVGGDILADKKTFLHVTCKERCTLEQHKRLTALLKSGVTSDEKIQGMKTLYIETGAADALRSQIDHYHDLANSLLEEIKPSEPARSLLAYVTSMVSTRTT